MDKLSVFDLAKHQAQLERERARKEARDKRAAEEGENEVWTDSDDNGDDDDGRTTRGDNSERETDCIDAVLEMKQREMEARERSKKEAATLKRMWNPKTGRLTKFGQTLPCTVPAQRVVVLDDRGVRTWVVVRDGHGQLTPLGQRISAILPDEWQLCFGFGPGVDLETLPCPDSRHAVVCDVNGVARLVALPPATERAARPGTTRCASGGDDEPERFVIEDTDGSTNGLTKAERADWVLRGILPHRALSDPEFAPFAGRCRWLDAERKRVVVPGAGTLTIGQARSHNDDLIAMGLGRGLPGREGMDPPSEPDSSDGDRPHRPQARPRPRARPPAPPAPAKRRAAPPRGQFGVWEKVMADKRAAELRQAAYLTRQELFERERKKTKARHDGSLISALPPDQLRLFRQARDRLTAIPRHLKQRLARLHVAGASAAPWSDTDEFAVVCGRWNVPVPLWRRWSRLLVPVADQTGSIDVPSSIVAVQAESRLMKYALRQTALVLSGRTEITRLNQHRDRSCEDETGRVKAAIRDRWRAVVRRMNRENDEAADILTAEEATPLFGWDTLDAFVASLGALDVLDGPDGVDPTDTERLLPQFRIGFLGNDEQQPEEIPTPTPAAKRQKVERAQKRNEERDKRCQLVLGWMRTNPTALRSPPLTAEAMVRLFAGEFDPDFSSLTRPVLSSVLLELVKRGEVQTFQRTPRDPITYQAVGTEATTTDATTTTKTEDEAKPHPKLAKRGDALLGWMRTQTGPLSAVQILSMLGGADLGNEGKHLTSRQAVTTVLADLVKRKLVEAFRRCGEACLVYRVCVGNDE